METWIIEKLLLLMGFKRDLSIGERNDYKYRHLEFTFEKGILKEKNSFLYKKITVKNFLNDVFDLLEASFSYKERCYMLHKLDVRFNLNIEYETSKYWTKKFIKGVEGYPE